MTKKPEKNHHSNSFILDGDSSIGILLLHGWTSLPEEPRQLANYLNSFGCTVYTPLLRGHGTEPEDLVGVTWQDWLEDARKALEELKKYSSKIFVGGISMGGNLAMLLSEDENVVGVFTMGAAMKYKLHFLIRPALFFMGLAKTYHRKYYPPWVRKKMGKRDVYPYYPIESAKEVVKLADATREFLPSITKPILIMQSMADHMVSKKSPQMIFNGVKSEIKEIFWIKNAYHVFAENEKVHEKIGKFILRITS